MNEIAADTGDTNVHYAYGSGTFPIRKRLNAARENKSVGVGERLFQSEMKRNNGKCFRVFVRENGRNILWDEPRVELFTRS